MVWNDVLIGWEGAAGSDVNTRNPDPLLPLLVSSSKWLSWSLSRLVSLAKTALLAWIIPNPVCDSPGGLDMGVGPWAGCVFSAAQRAAPVTLKIHVLIFEQEGATLGLLSSGSGLPCQSFGLICLKKQGGFTVPKAEQNTSARCLCPSQCGLLIPGSGRKASLCLLGVCGTRLCQTMRQKPVVIELGQKKNNESRRIWVGGWRNCLCLCMAVLTVPAHTGALQGAGSLAPTNTAARGELFLAESSWSSGTEKQGWKQCLSS